MEPVRTAAPAKASNILHCVWRAGSFFSDPDEFLHRLHLFFALLHRQARFGQNLTENAGTDLLVIGHDDAGVRVTAPEDNMAPSLAVHDKSYAQKDLHQFLAGNVLRQFHRGLLVTSSRYSLPASVGTGSPAAMQSSM